MTERIKPCPFCGQAGEVVECEEHGYFVRCADVQWHCNSRPQVWNTGNDRQLAIDAWNTRGYEDREAALEAQRDNLFNENKALYRQLVAMQKQLDGKDAKKPRH